MGLGLSKVGPGLRVNEVVMSGLLYGKEKGLNDSVFIYIHYQKIHKYKRKYRENIFVGKFSRDFTDENILSVYTERITAGKNNFKQSKKKMMTCQFLPTELPMEKILSVKSVSKFVDKL